MSSVYNQCRISRFTSLRPSISENRTSKVCVVGYWVQSQHRQTSDASSYVNLRALSQEVLGIGWDTSGFVNGEFSHHEQANMRANHHMEEEERAGGWNLWSGPIQISEAIVGGRDNRLATELVLAR